jgi:hypothetical protein
VVKIMLSGIPFCASRTHKTPKEKKKKRKCQQKGQGYEVGKIFDKKILPDHKAGNIRISKKY